MVARAEAKLTGSPRGAPSAETILSEVAQLLPRDPVRKSLYAAMRRILRSDSDSRNADELLAIARRCFRVVDSDEG